MASQLAILGAGTMAEAITRGILSAASLAPDQIIAADISPERREFFSTQLNVQAIESVPQAAAAVAGQERGVILLCVKPAQVESVLLNVRDALTEATLIVSIAAGISTAFIEKNLGKRKFRVVRAMPNLPLIVGEGMVAIAAGRHAGLHDLNATRTLFQSAGRVMVVPEEKIDAVTAVSGSGPAYVFYLVEQMIRAGVELGLTPDEARQLAVQTARGAATMLSQSFDEPAEQRRRVTTPNGTTHAAIALMESRNWPQATVDAIKAAAQRSRELGKK